MKTKTQKYKQEVNQTTGSTVQLRRPFTPTPTTSNGMETAVHTQTSSPQTSLVGRAQQMRTLQRKVGNARVSRLMNTVPVQQKTNKTGLPDNLKSGVETLSGLSMDDVRVHYNSAKPAQLQALAYTQGTDIHVAPGQEKHLAHEAWHVVQQMQGRVNPTIQTKGVSINDDAGLEFEADEMGAKALQMQPVENNEVEVPTYKAPLNKITNAQILQPKWLDNKGSDLYEWHELRDGVQWYYSKIDGKMFYRMIQEIPKVHLSFYKKYANSKMTREEWMSLGVWGEEYFKREDANIIPLIVDDDSQKLTDDAYQAGSWECPGIPMNARVLIISDSFHSKKNLGDKFKGQKSQHEENTRTVDRTFFIGDEWSRRKFDELKASDDKHVFEWNWIDQSGGLLPGKYDLIVARSMICPCDRDAAKIIRDRETQKVTNVIIESTCGGIGPDKRVTVLLKVAGLLRGRDAKAVLTNSPTKSEDAKAIHPYGMGYWVDAIDLFNADMKGKYIASIIRTNHKDWYMGFLGIEIRKIGE